MKNLLSCLAIYAFLSLSLNSCSKNDEEIISPQEENFQQTLQEENVEQTLKAGNNYSAIEVEVMKLINNHRKSIGLKQLTTNDFISKQAKSHNNYMIRTGKLGHDNFSTRYNAISRQLKTGYMGENVAKGQTTAKQVFSSWLNSKPHRASIEGKKYTLFGIAITADAKGVLFYTNIFAG
jgi:uncharacterized protein YkwD